MVSAVLMTDKQMAQLRREYSVPCLPVGMLLLSKTQVNKRKGSMFISVSHRRASAKRTQSSGLQCWLTQMAPSREQHICRETKDRDQGFRFVGELMEWSLFVLSLFTLVIFFFLSWRGTFWVIVLISFTQVKQDWQRSLYNHLVYNKCNTEVCLKRIQLK